MAHPRVGGSAASILVIEDHPATARGMCALLRSRGHRVETAADVATGIARILRKRYDLVLTDLDLGGEGGPDLVTRMRVTRPGLALLVVTARDRSSVLRALDDVAGVDCLEKPVDPERLVAAVESLLPRRAAPSVPTHSN